jgi:hypothetical protein
MLQNTVRDVTGHSYVKLLNDMVVTRSEPAVGFEEYLELQFPECATDTKIASHLDLDNIMHRKVLFLALIMMCQISLPS